MANATIASDDDVCRQNNMHDPIFVVGNSRSGTTMMGRILAGHPRIFTFHELHFLEGVFIPARSAIIMDGEEARDLAATLLCIQRDGFLSQGDRLRYKAEAENMVPAHDVDNMTAFAVFRCFLRYETERCGRQIACDQTPRNVFYIEEILRAFQNARIINMVRDPRDVLLSQKAKWKRRFLGARNIPLGEAVRSWINYHPITISRLWRASVHAAERFKTHPQVMFLRFEDLVTNPEDSVTDLCRFLGIEYSREMLSVPRVGSSHTNDEPGRSGIDPGRSGAWRTSGLSQTEVYLCEWVTATEMVRYGYVTSGARPNMMSLLTRMVLLPLQLAVAVLVNLYRTRNLWDTLRRRLV